MAEKSLIEQADALGHIPMAWPNTRMEATALLVARMAREIERLQQIIDHLCPDKLNDI